MKFTTAVRKSTDNLSSTGKRRVLCNAYICNLFRIRINQRQKKVTETYIVCDFFQLWCLPWREIPVMNRTYNTGNNFQLAGWCTDTCTGLSLTRQTATHSICCSFCCSVPVVVAVPLWSVPQRSHQPPPGHSAFTSPRETKLVLSTAELCLLALAVTRAGRVKRLLPWHSGKWRGLHCPV